MKKYRENEMKTCVFLALLLSTSISIVLSWSTVPTDKVSLRTYNKGNYLFNLASAEQQNITIHNGDMFLDNDDIIVIKDAQLDLNGSLLMTGNSTLILDNGILYPAFEKGEHSYILRDNAKIIMQRGSKIVSGIFDFIIYDNALVNMSDSYLEKSITIDLPNATLHAVKSEIRSVWLYAPSRLHITNSTAGQLLCFGDACIVDSHIQSLVVAQNAYPIYVDLVNSTYDQLDTTNLGKGIVHIKWYLMISVESQGTSLQGVNVQVYYAVNNSLAAHQTTSSDGRVRFELPEWEITERGNTYLGNYTIKANKDETQIQENIILNSSKQIALSMSINDSETLQAVLYIILVIIGVLVLIFAILVIRFSKKQIKKKDPPHLKLQNIGRISG